MREKLCKKQKVLAFNECIEWDNAIKQRKVFLSHVNEMLKLFELYPQDFIPLQIELTRAKEKTEWSIKESAKQFAFTKMRFDAGMKYMGELE